MDAEKMREILATKCMGWTRGKGAWDDHWESAEDDLIMTRGSWQPDRDWSQCGLVIEAMQAKGWILNLEDWGNSKGNDTRWYVAYEKGDRCDETCQCYEAIVTGDTFCPAVSLTAYRALEANDGCEHKV